MTLKEAFQYGEKTLKAAGIGDASLDAWYLLEEASGVSRAAYFAGPDRKLDQEQKETYFRFIETRARRIPLQHITGNQEFMGLSFLVNEHVLVPRQDTEVLVEETLKIIKPGMRILDMCTGSGCILVSLLKLGEEISPAMWKTDPVLGVGVDISPEALLVAKKNAERLNVPVLFLCGDLYEALEESQRGTADMGTDLPEQKFDMIVSNPPYIRTEVIAELEAEVRLHDPWIALDGKADGLYFYREITEGSSRYLKKGGRLLFEIGYDQAQDVVRLMENQGFTQVTVKKDLAGLDRVVSGVYN